MPQLEQEFDLYVKARCGEVNHESTKKTEPDKNGNANPVWTEKHKNRLQLCRHPRDEGVLLLEVWDFDRWGTDDFVGGVCTFVAVHPALRRFKHVLAL